MSPRFRASLPPVLLALILLLAPTVRAARVRPAFDPPLGRQRRVTGVVRLRVVARSQGLSHEMAPIGSGSWAAVVRIDGRTLATLRRLPAEVEWDTRAAGDGLHEVHVAVRNTRSGVEVGVEGGGLMVDNASEVPDAATLTPPAQARVATATPRLSTSPDPLAGRATALLRTDSRLYLGLPDGGVAFLRPDTGSRSGSVVRLPAPDGPARALTIGADRLWWTTGEGRTVWAYSEALGSLTRYEVATDWVRRIVVLDRNVLLLGDRGQVRRLDPRTGALDDPALLPDLLPPPDNAAARLQLAAQPDGSALLARVTVAPAPPPHGPWAPDLAATSPCWTAQLWRRAPGGGWSPLGSAVTDADPCALALDARGLVSAEGSLVRRTTDSGLREFPLAMDAPVGPLAFTPSALWWEQRGVICRADASTGARDAYLPWNFPGEPGAILALAADEGGVWVATMSAGVRRIRHGRPTTRTGYDGYVRARLGADTLRPPTPRAARVATAIQAWQGVPYVWGGQSRSGTDCSGFVMRMHQVGGVAIPRTSLGMRGSSRGRHIVDELRWGDTLVYPGHCALYVGDGCTAETVGGTGDGKVSHASVWVRSNVVVRRFLR